MPLHSHPHEQLGIVLRGMQALVVDGVRASSGRWRDTCSPAVSSTPAYCGPDGATVLDVFQPVRDDYRERWEQRAQ